MNIHVIESTQVMFSRRYHNSPPVKRVVNVPKWRNECVRPKTYQGGKPKSLYKIKVMPER